jgi:two-component system, OmpR family, phosphate regulon sensor histidine kinase PhoR
LLNLKINLMRSFKPLILSAWFSLILSVLVTLVAVFTLKIDMAWYYMAIIVLPVNFLIILFGTAYFVNRFIEGRLKPIFKIIRDLPVEEVRKAKELQRRFDFNLDVNTEVTKWATHKQEEIKRLKELEQYRKEFVGNVSHELKTPIFNIQGYILTLLEGGLDDPRINKLYLERTVKSIDRIISIVEDLESINKLESGELKLRKESFDMVKLTDDVFEIEHMIARDRKISLEFAAKYDKPVLVYADKKRMMELMSNLVINGIKYSKKRWLR